MATTQASAPSIKQAPEYREVREKLIDREWRLDNLYRIQDKDGNDIQFVRNAAQRQFGRELWYRNSLTKARQIGFSTLMAMVILDQSLFIKGYQSGIIDATLDDAKLKLKKLTYAYHRLPVALREEIALTKENEGEIEFSNGSKVSVGTSHRGGTLQMLHVSEYGKVAAEKPDVAVEIKTGGFNAVAKNGVIVVESTAHGTSGEFHGMVMRGLALKKQGTKLTNLDFKAHFFGWWVDPQYTLPPNLVVLTAEMRDYFKMLRAKYSIVLSPGQQAWYAKMHSELGPDKMREEYPSTIDECFYNSQEGTYFKAQINLAREQRRIGLPVPHNPAFPVHTTWDLGMDDYVSIVFFQIIGQWVNFIDYMEGSDEDLPYWFMRVDEKRIERRLMMGKHYGPHDLAVREMFGKGKTRFEQAEALGFKFTPVGQLYDKADGINAARKWLGSVSICQQHASLLVERLENYKKKWNKTIGAFSGDPLHDINSHAADAVINGALGVEPERVRMKRVNVRSSGSAWAE